METCYWPRVFPAPSRFLSYLWGMETYQLYIPIDLLLGYSSYPTYEEWKQKNDKKRMYTSSVLILPMRNGNAKVGNYFKNEGEVLILPMRNGNYRLPVCQHISLLFLSYLWGMETSLTLSFHFSRVWVLILPMRNGNYESIINISAPPLFLSYLWGMETTHPLCMSRLCSF